MSDNNNEGMNSGKCKGGKGFPLILVTLVLSIILFLGVEFVFHACGPKDDGSYMRCRWAQQTVFALGGLMTSFSILQLIVKCRGAKMAFAAATGLTAILTMLVPNILIPLCMMTTMRCHAVMRPSVIVNALLILASCVIYLILNLRKSNKNA